MNAHRQTRHTGDTEHTGGTGHAQHHRHTGDMDWDGLADELEREADLHAEATGRAADWLRGVRGGAADAPTRVLDAGSGPGAVACLLARAFPGAEVVAADGSAALLERARARAEQEGLGDRVRTRRARLPEDLDTLGTADLVWTGHVVHHLGDQQAALAGLARVLRPGGVLAVLEGGLAPRFLPRDFGRGRPGFQARLDALQDAWFADMRASLPDSAEVVEDWPAMLARAGLEPAGTRTFLTEHPAPLPRPAREHVRDRLARIRDKAGERLDQEDLRTLETLVDPDSPEGVLRRPEVFWLSARTVHAAVRP